MTWRLLQRVNLTAALTGEIVLFSMQAPMEASRISFRRPQELSESYSVIIQAEPSLRL
jgi:hypothetical protein